MKVAFTTRGWDDYDSWLAEDKKILRKINQLIKEAKRDPGAGTGKAESLKGDLSGCWSRRITQEHRLVYTVQGDTLLIIQARYHY